MDKDHIILCLAQIEVIIKKYIHVYPERQEVLTDIQQIRKEILNDSHTNSGRTERDSSSSNEIT